MVAMAAVVMAKGGNGASENNGNGKGRSYGEE